MTSEQRPEGRVRGAPKPDTGLCARIDARVAAEEAAGVPLPDRAQARDNGPDPLGIDWAWAAPEPSPAAADPTPGPTTPSRQPERWAAPRYAYYAGGAVVAASLLVAAGALFTRGDGRGTEMAARVTVDAVQNRGPGDPVVLSVENRSARPGFVTVVGVRGARSPVHPALAEGFLDVAPGQVRRVTLPPAFAAETDAVVVLTATPAGEAVARAFDGGGVPTDPAAARDKVAAALNRFGYAGATCELVRLNLPGR